MDLNYVDKITKELGAVLDDCDDDLLRCYALLVLALGVNVTEEDLIPGPGGWIEGEPPRNDGELPSGIEIEVRGSFRLTVGNINQMGGSCDDCQGDFDGITRWRKLDPDAAYRAGLQAANNAITWNTTCLNCSALLDIGIREHEAGYRAGREAAARDIEAIAEEAGWGEVWAQCVSLARGTSSLGRSSSGDERDTESSPEVERRA